MARGNSGIDYADFKTRRDTDARFAYDDRQTMLYALAAGMGRNPVDQKELKFVYEADGFVAMPTLAVTIARSRLPRTLPIDFTKVLHGEQTLRVHRPLPIAAELSADTRITHIVDKGAQKGAIIYHETVARQVGEDDLLFTVGGSLFARGDGGYEGPSDTAPAPYTIPDREPDLIHESCTRPDQALLYRLTGDRNPLHADPALAKKAGFDAPILHGLCTYAVACRAILASVCDYDPARIASFDVRFTKPVIPGEQIRTAIWREKGSVAFRCSVPKRDDVVLDNGRCELR